MNYCIFKLTINKAFNSIKKKKGFKPKIPATRSAMWLNDFEFDVI